MRPTQESSTPSPSTRDPSSREAPCSPKCRRPRNRASLTGHAVHKPARKVPPAFRQKGASMPGFAGTIKAHGVTDAEACDGYREEEVRGWLLTCWSGELGSGAGVGGTSPVV